MHAHARTRTHPPTHTHTNTHTHTRAHTHTHTHTHTRARARPARCTAPAPADDPESAYPPSPSTHSTAHWQGLGADCVINYEAAQWSADEAHKPTVILDAVGSEQVAPKARCPSPRAARGPRLYVKGVMTSFQRSKRSQTSHTVLIKLQGVNDKAEVDFYKGKRVCYIYKAPTEKNGARFRTIWGKVTGAHGSIGGVKAKFQTNMPTKALGQPVRVMLYPSQI